MFTTWTKLIYVVLDDARCDHGSGRRDETPCDLLQRGEADSHAFEAWVDEEVTDGDENDKGDGVNVVDEIVGSAVEFHGCGLRDQVIGHLIVGEPPHRVPEKDSAGFETSTNFIDPDIIKSHPSRFVRPQFARLDIFPEVI